LKASDSSNQHSVNYSKSKYKSSGPPCLLWGEITLQDD
jgi:hypothetical protein